MLRPRLEFAARWAEGWLRRAREAAERKLAAAIAIIIKGWQR
jgi:hypothetical protein